MTYFISFNINGIRARPHQLEALTRLAQGQLPDVIGLQETKVHDEAFPLADIERLGYHVEYFGQNRIMAWLFCQKLRLNLFKKAFWGRMQKHKGD